MNKSIQGNANGLVEQAKQTVANVASDTKAGVTTQLEQRIDHAKEIGLEKIETVSDALRGASEKLEGTGPLPDLANKAAEGIENLANYFENRNIGDVINGIQSFAKREPALFLGGAVALGMLAGRFLKSSSRRAPAAVEGGDQFETYGFEGEYGSSSYGAEGDYMSADALEDDWETADTAEEPMVFESEDKGIGAAAPITPLTGSSTFDSRSTKPQFSSPGAVGVGAETRGNTEKMPKAQGPIGSSSTNEQQKSDDFFGNKSGR